MLLNRWRAARLPLILMIIALVASLGLSAIFAQDDGGSGEGALNAPALLSEEQATEEAQVPPPTETLTPTATFTPTLTPTTPPPTAALLSVTRSEPGQVISGQEGVLSVFGANFTASTVIRLVGVGLLPTTVVNANALTAALPLNLLPGQYAIEVSDPGRGSAQSPNMLTVLAPTMPPPTSAPPATPMTFPTPIPGEPSLIVRNFAAMPTVTTPGGMVRLTLEVVNQGTAIALGVSLSVDSGAKFVPANGQASAVLPNIAPGTAVTVTLDVVASMDATRGPNSVPITISYRSVEGESFTSNAALSVNIETVDEVSQVTLARYLADPNPVEPGQPMTLTVLVTNTGNETASQVLLRITGADSVLLAGPQGDSFPLGDIAPGASAGLELPLIVSAGAKAGPQAQPFTITYIQRGESKETTGSLTVMVAEAEVQRALLLLEAYDVGADVLQPGERFTLSMTLRNVGNAAADELLVTFGTVESSGGVPSGGDPGSDPGSGSGSGGSGGQTSTTPSTTFAPLGAGGTIYVGMIGPNGGEVTLEQEFIVNGTTDSGIYSLPITLRYLKPDGSSAQENLRASVVVVAPARLQIDWQNEPPESVNVGEPVQAALSIANIGRKPINFTTAVVEVENGELMGPAQTFIGALAIDDDTTVDASAIPLNEGSLRVTVTLNYYDDLNREQTIVRSYEAEVVAPEMPPDFGPPVDMPTPTPEPPSSEDTIGQILLGLLGLGS